MMRVCSGPFKRCNEIWFPQRFFNTVKKFEEVIVMGDFNLARKLGQS